MQKNTTLLFFAFLLLTHFSFSQKEDSTKRLFHFSGSVSVTNNGISLVPTFSLGKPAAMGNLSMGKGKLSFEPDLRFSLEGKPWSFLFWWRYKLFKTKKLAINIGAHPALNFKTETVSTNGISKELIVSRRYLAAELTPNYLLSKNISIGIYYLYSHGIDDGTTKNTHFLTLNSNFAHIKVSNQYYIKFTPQLYYLNMDKKDGFYFTSALTVAKKNFPVSLSAIINKTIHTDITASKNFVWNTTLIYAFK